MLFDMKTCRTLLLASFLLVSQADVVHNSRRGADEYGDLSTRSLYERDLYKRGLAQRDTYSDNIYTRDVDDVDLFERNGYVADLFERSPYDASFLEGDLYKRHIYHLIERDLHARAKAASKGPKDSKKARRCPARGQRASNKGSRPRKRAGNHLVEMSDIDFEPAPQPIGTDGMCGCTAIIIAGPGGAIVGHLDEMEDDKAFETAWKSKLETKIGANKAALTSGKAYISYPLGKTSALYPKQVEMLTGTISKALPGVNIKSVGYVPLDMVDDEFGRNARGTVDVKYENKQAKVYIEGKAQ